MNAQDRDQYHSAADLLNKKRFAEAFVAYSELARAGDPRCQVFLGWMYAEGIGTTKDEKQALRWYQNAARLGSTEGAYYCGRHALRGGEFDRALEWLRAAAQNEYGPALLWLGIAYVRGLGVDQDLGKGVGYLKRAADTGNYLARRHLALLMIRGKLGILRIPLGIVLLPFVMIVGILDGLILGYSHRLMG